jgi:hypothetical protein
MIGLGRIQRMSSIAKAKSTIKSTIDPSSLMADVKKENNVFK